MPIATRRQARNLRTSEQSTEEAPSDDGPTTGDVLEDESGQGPDVMVDVEVEDGAELEVEEDDEQEEEEGEFTDREEPFPPPGLKEISSLASWTVSTCKPGNGVAALRSPSPSQFWQSDGPQPHYLTIHFFKLVQIVHIRLYIDFSQDESYTPTKMQFWAGMAMHDLELFSEMALEQPMGWVDVDMGAVGPIAEDESGDEEEREEGEVDWSKRPVLRAFVVQVKILENHQNGKDTHLRAVQLFARDESVGLSGGGRRQNVSEKSNGGFLAEVPVRAKGTFGMKKANNLKLADWMMDPEIR